MQVLKLQFINNLFHDSFHSNVGFKNYFTPGNQEAHWKETLFYKTLNKVETLSGICTRYIMMDRMIKSKGEGSSL